MSANEVRSYWLLSGHFPLAFYLKHPVADYQVITVLRDPVDRELSAYFYMRNWKDHPRHGTIGQMDLHEFVEHREKHGRTNLQCTMLSGTDSFAAACKAIEKHRIFAAPVDYLTEFCQTLGRRLGIGPVPLGRENVTQSRLGVDEVPPEIRKRLHQLTEDDQRLYRDVKRRFEQQTLGRPKPAPAVSDERPL